MPPVAPLHAAPVQPPRAADLVRAAPPAAQPSPARSLPVVDGADRVVGVINERDLYRQPNVDVIMVDHNELSLAVEGLDQFRVVEIIDHHKLGNFPTHDPIDFINRTVRSTAPAPARPRSRPCRACRLRKRRLLPAPRLPRVPHGLHSAVRRAAAGHRAERAFRRDAVFFRVRLVRLRAQRRLRRPAVQGLQAAQQHAVRIGRLPLLRHCPRQADKRAEQKVSLRRMLIHGFPPSCYLLTRRSGRRSK